MERVLEEEAALEREKKAKKKAKKDAKKMSSQKSSNLAPVSSSGQHLSKE